MSSACQSVRVIAIQMVFTSVLAGGVWEYARAAPISSGDPPATFDTPEDLAKKKNKELLAKAEQSRQKKDLRQAVRIYGEYLLLVPDDREVQATQALAAAAVTSQKDVRAKDVLLAEMLLRTALFDSELRERRDLRRKLIDIQILLGQPQQAMLNIDRLTDPTQPDPELDFLYARCAYATNSFNLAVKRLAPLTGYVTAADGRSEVFDPKKATDAKNIDAYLLLALILRENKKLHPEADACVNAMVAANPQSANAFLKRSAFQMRFAADGTQAENEFRKKGAREDVRRALVIEPDNVDALMQSADLEMKDKNYDAALGHIRHAIKFAPKNERLYLGLASVLWAQQKPKEAISAIEQGLKESPQNPDLVWGLQEIHWRAGDVAGLKKSIEQMEAMKFMPERLQLAKARIPFAEKNWREAAEQLEEVRPRLSQHAHLALSADLALGHCYAKLKQPDRQLGVCNRILKSDANSVEALRGKAAALTALMRYEEALEVYQKHLAAALGKEAFMADGALKEGYQAVLTALSQRDRVPAAIRRADMLVRNKQPEEGLALLKKEIAADPQDVRLRLAVVALVATIKGPDAALVALDEVERELGPVAKTHMVRAELTVRQAGTDVRQNMAKLENGISKFPPEQQAELWERLGMSYYRLGAPGRGDVLRCWGEALKLRPDQAPLLESIFEFARASHDGPLMVEVQRKIAAALGEKSSLWNYAEAARLVDQVRERGIQAEGASLSEATQRVAQALKQGSRWHRLHLLQAEIMVLTDRPEEAIRHYQVALVLGPPDSATVQKLAELQISGGKYKEARETLRNVGDVSGKLGRMRIFTEVLGGGDPAQALQDLEQEVPGQSTNPADLLWKGQLLVRLNEMDKAEKALRRAVELGPTMPQNWLALVEFLARYRNVADAERAIHDAENQLPKDQVPLVLAQCYAQLQSYDIAEQHYLTALKAGAEKPALRRTVADFYLATRQSVKAAEMLKKLIESPDKLSVEDKPHVAWARRQLAILMAQDPAYTSLQNAVRLVEVNASAGIGCRADELLIARLYASRRDLHSLRQAERIFEQHRNAIEFGFEEQLALASVYVRTNQWEKGRYLLQELSAEKPDDMRAPLLIAESLLKRKDAGAVEPWIQRLEKAQPALPQTIRLKAMMVLNHQGAAEAEAIVLGPLPKEATASQAAQFVAAAGILEDLKNYPAAEKVLRQGAALSPAVQGDLAEFLARRGQTDAALALAKQQLTDDTLETACQIGLAALREEKALSGKVSPAHSKIVLSWFDQATRRPKASVRQLMNQALLYDLLGRTESAAGIYREILKRPDVPALLGALVSNNLAYLLAFNGGNLEQAQELANVSLSQMGRVSELLDTLAVIALAKGDHAEAIKLLAEATEVGGSAEMFLHLALAHQIKGDRTAAQRWLDRAHEEGLRIASLPNAERQRLEALQGWLKS